MIQGNIQNHLEQVSCVFTNVHVGQNSYISVKNPGMLSIDSSRIFTFL